MCKHKTKYYILFVISATMIFSLVPIDLDFSNNIFWGLNTYEIIYYTTDGTSDCLNNAEIILKNNIYHNSNTYLSINPSNLPHSLLYNLSSNQNFSQSCYECIEHSDPMFVDVDSEIHDFRLQDTSPCIDTGTPNSSYNDPNGTRNDMGIFGGPNSLFTVGPFIKSFNVTPLVLPLGEDIQVEAEAVTE